MAGPNLFHAICLKLVHCVTLRHTWGMHEVSSMEIESSQPCDICGDTGYAKAILTCSICFKSREHIYCMRFNLDYVPDTWHCEACQRRKMDYDGPRKFNDEEAQKLSERKKILAMRNASSEVLYVSQCVDSSSDQLALHRLTRNFVLHKVETGNDKFISVEDFCAMSSAAKPKPSSSQRYSSSQVGFFTSNYCYMPKMTSSALETDKHHSNKFVKSPNPLPSGNLVISTSEKEPTKLSQPLHDLKYLKPENLNSVTVTEKVYGRHTSDTAYHSPLNYTGPSFDGVEGKSEAESVFSGMDQYADQFDSVLYIDNVLGEEPIHALLNFSEDGASKEICLPKSGEGNVPKTPKVNYSGPVLDVQEKLYLENTKSILDKHEGEADLFMFKDVYTEKTLDVAAAHFDESEISTSKTSFKFWEQDMLSLPEVRWSWKGSFEILNNHPRLYDDLQAYPPGRVSGKAYLVSKQMPRILQFTLHPHHDVWPNNLRTDSPFDLDTALYFLPIDFCRPKEKYSGLVELMEKEDLSLQSRLDGVDLLVFTPRRLPFGAQGMNRQVYLCGVFLSSTGSHSSYGLKEKQHTVDFPLPSYGISEDSVTDHKCDGVVTDMEIDMIGRKEVESVNKSLGSNSMDACTSNLSLTSQGVHPVYKSNSAAHLHEVKQEYCDIDTSPGLFSVYSSHALREATISKHIDQVKEDYYDAFDAHPVSRPVTSTATFVGPISVPHVQMTPSGFSELLKPKQWDSSPKQSPSISNTNLVATSSFCITSILPYQLSLPSDRLNPLPSVSDDRNGHGRINVKGRVPHHQVKNRFTPEQKDKMFIFAEKAGWSIRNQEDALVQKFCEEVGISRNALKVWMYNTKHALKIHSSTACIRKPESPVKKRFKTKFTQEQKDKMWSFAEKVGWRITKQEEAEVQQFCKEVGISRRILKFWICNNKKHLKMKLSSA